MDAQSSEALRGLPRGCWEWLAIRTVTIPAAARRGVPSRRVGYQSLYPETGTVQVAIRTVESVSEEWDRLAEHLRAAPFLRPGWITAWWRAFGHGSLRVFTVRTEDRLMGLVPIVRQGSLLRSPTNSETPIFGFLVDDGEGARHLAAALLSVGVRRWDLSFLRPNDSGSVCLREEARSRGFRTVTRLIARSPYVNTEGDWSVYEASVDAKLRSEVRRRRRRLEEQGELSLEIADGSEELNGLLDEGFRVERSGWKGEYGTAIDADPRTRRFYKDIARWAREQGWLRLAFLRLDGRAIAFDLCLETDESHFLLKTGYDQDFHRFGPGVLLRTMMLERAFLGRVNTYEFLGTVLGANNRWKLDWTQESHGYMRFVAFAGSARGTAEWSALRYGDPILREARAVASNILGSSGRHFVKAGRRRLYDLVRR
jgi:CelD/BcsL family acetyltransferase involved in cellulose biosynthesis